MEIIANATFLIYSIKTDIGILKELGLETTKGVAMEVENELGVDLNELGVAIKRGERKAPIPEDERKYLSETDIHLIDVAFEERKRCILITDDRLLRRIAKDNKIRCYTTPLFVALLLKERKISKEKCLAFLKALKDMYIRIKDVEKIVERVEGW